MNAGLQPQQAERYQLRGDSYIARGDCAAYHTVIVAPARYFADSNTTKGFGSRITYEQILHWFLEAESLGNRRHYKAALLRSAIDKGTLGYQPEEDAPTTDFWCAYWLSACDYAPELELKEPGPKPSGSDYIYFQPPSLPRGVEICHKFRRGYVDLQLSGMGKRLNEVRAILGPHFGPDMQLTQTAKSAAVRLEVPVLTADLPVADQLSEARAGLDAAKRFLVWFLEHQDIWLAHISSAQQGAPADAPGATRPPRG